MTDLPAPFIERTRRLLGDDYPRFAEALESESPTSIRLNPSKSTPTGTIGDPVLWARHGFYLSSRPTFTFDPRLHAGAYYVQEAASMFLNRVIRQYVHELRRTIQFLTFVPHPVENRPMPLRRSRSAV